MLRKVLTQKKKSLYDFKFFNFKNTDLYITFYGRPGLKYIANFERHYILTLC